MAQAQEMKLPETIVEALEGFHFLSSQLQPCVEPQQTPLSFNLLTNQLFLIDVAAFFKFYRIDKKKKPRKRVWD